MKFAPFSPRLKEKSMNQTWYPPSTLRVVACLSSAMAIAILMLAAAWMKRSAAPAAAGFWEVVVLILATTSMLVPMLALPTSSRGADSEDPR
jgi:hypothetical protein